MGRFSRKPSTGTTKLFFVTFIRSHSVLYNLCPFFFWYDVDINLMRQNVFRQKMEGARLHVERKVPDAEQNEE